MQRVPQSGTADGAAESLSASDLGLSPPQAVPVEFTPGDRMTPLVISVPHAGLEWPSELGPRPQVNFIRNADHGVDQLYATAHRQGAAVVTARFSRLVLDLNRAHDDVSRDIVPDHPAPQPRPLSSSIARAVLGRGKPPRNRGVLWSMAVGNIPLFQTLPYARLADRLDRYYFPYYRALDLLLERRRKRFGFAVLLDGHSMPSIVGHDLVLGTRQGHSCHSEMITQVAHALRGSPPQRRPSGSRLPMLSLQIDTPYEGGHIVESRGRPDQGIHAIQLEISRHLYMDEQRLQMLPFAGRSAGELSPTVERGPAPATYAQPQTLRRIALQQAIDRMIGVLVDWKPSESY